MAKLFKYIKFFVSIFLISYLFLSIDLKNTFYVLAKSEFVYLIIASVLTILGVIISSFKWKILLHANSVVVSFKKLLQLYFIGFFLNNFLPTSIGGDVFRGRYLSTNLKIKLSFSFASIVVERILGVVSLSFFIFIGIFLNFDLIKKININYINIYYFIILLFLVVLIILFRGGRARSSTTKFNFKIFNKIFCGIKNLYNNINFYKDKKRVIFRCLGASFIFQGIVIINIYLYILAINNFIPLSRLIFIVPLVSLISLIPISINGIGVTEGVFIYFFTILGLSAVEALSVALLARGIKLTISLIGGVLYFLE